MTTITITVPVAVYPRHVNTPPLRQARHLRNRDTTRVLEEGARSIMRPASNRLTVAYDLAHRTRDVRFRLEGGPGDGHVEHSAIPTGGELPLVIQHRADRQDGFDEYVLAREDGPGVWVYAYWSPVRSCADIPDSHVYALAAAHDGDDDEPGVVDALIAQGVPPRIAVAKVNRMIRRDILTYWDDDERRSPWPAPVDGSGSRSSRTNPFNVRHRLARTCSARGLRLSSSGLSPFVSDVVDAPGAYPFARVRRRPFGGGFDVTDLRPGGETFNFELVRDVGRHLAKIRPTTPQETAQ